MQKICGNCRFFGTGEGGVGCGRFDVKPHYHQSCVFRPNRWEPKKLPPSKELVQPQEWHLTGQEPKKSEKSKPAKKGSKKRSKK
jgi:hypothetical protein